MCELNSLLFSMPRSYHESTCYWVVGAYYVMSSKCNVWLLLLKYESCRLIDVKAFVRLTKEGKGFLVNSGGY